MHFWVKKKRKNKKNGSKRIFRRTNEEKPSRSRSLYLYFINAFSKASLKIFPRTILKKTDRNKCGKRTKSMRRDERTEGSKASKSYNFFILYLTFLLRRPREILLVYPLLLFYSLLPPPAKKKKKISISFCVFSPLFLNFCIFRTSAVQKKKKINLWWKPFLFSIFTVFLFCRAVGKKKGEGISFHRPKSNNINF